MEAPGRLRDRLASPPDAPANHRGGPADAPRARPCPSADPRWTGASHRRSRLSQQATNSAHSPAGERGRCLHSAGFASVDRLPGPFGGSEAPLPEPLVEGRRGLSRGLHQVSCADQGKIMMNRLPQFLISLMLVCLSVRAQIPTGGGAQLPANRVYDNYEYDQNGDAQSDGGFVTGSGAMVITLGVHRATGALRPLRQARPMPIAMTSSTPTEASLSL